MLLTSATVAWATRMLNSWQCCSREHENQPLFTNNEKNIWKLQRFQKPYSPKRRPFLMTDRLIQFCIEEEVFNTVKLSCLLDVYSTSCRYLPQMCLNLSQMTKRTQKTSRLSRHCQQLQQELLVPVLSRPRRAQRNTKYLGIEGVFNFDMV